MMCMVVPAECLMKRSKWKLKALVLCSIYLILIDPALLCASGLLLNLFPSVKSWSQDDITKYTFWEACAMCPFVACVPIPVIFKLAFKRVPHQEKEAASSLDGYDRVSGTDAEPQGNSFGWKLCKVFYIYCSLCSLAQAFLAISSYPDLVKSELFGKSTLYSRALVGTLFFQSVALLCSLFCNFYILNSGERRELYLAGAISLCSYNFLYICHDYIVVAVGLEN
ncbi:AGL369Wp [Eremothecium gossypii ATCC 10895]|uniref:AGL369Wp n=1 Tax=Eremothecium gossypii (strain ATCC 10895 / CBS 109.51 / FGSC 9923 / NRRL Y-1056) TaxID=284811 RepID=Q751S3_EREGS|nr:AGL369Wp [Eremothecium gossypii ATCC 10895]AAS54121.1 AGL369Wp [Eremothecium gossypii ATCC 10895]AEY98447.1 FAGL369Wp [Eremothecium gossypii FDAG1]